MKVNNEKKSKQPITINYENKKLSIAYFIPLLLIAGFVPLITYAKYIDLTDTTQALYWTGQQTYLDFFSYWKSKWVIVLTAIALIIYIFLYCQKKLPLKNLKQYYIPLGIYAVFVVISTIFAIDTPTALWGFVDMYQGMFTLLSYVLITFLTINFVNNERDVRLFANAFLFLILVEGILGIGQYFGFDFFQTGLGKSLIVPGNIQVENLEFSFGPKTIYGTLFNTNFVGSFATLMLPLAVAFLLLAKTKKQRIVTGMAVILIIFTWIGCNSRAGYFGVAVSAVFGLWLFRAVILRNWKVSFSLVAVLVVLIVGLNFVSDGTIYNKIKSFNIFALMQNTEKVNNRYAQIENIDITDNIISIITDKDELKLKIEKEKLYFLDEKNIEMTMTQENNTISINDERFNRYKIIIPKNYPGITLRIEEPWKIRSVNFYIDNDNIKVLGSGGRITDPYIAESFKMFDGFESLASGRGYIWGRTIPMLKKYLLIGAGSDNFPLAFPQNDYVAKLNIGFDANKVVDKPHNMYLQVAINTGTISLLSILSIVFIYIFSGIKLYSKINFDSFDKYIGASSLISIIGYLAAGMFNDHIVSVAPLFWVILGIGISINIKLSKPHIERT